MERERTFNFAAGPSLLPTSVLTKAASEMLNYNGSGMSVMEISHRGPIFEAILEEAKDSMKSLLKIPDTHDILFLQGGASTQFSMVPLNLMPEGGSADHAITGNFSGIAASEAAKYGKVNIAADTTSTGHTVIPTQEELKLSSDASYFFYCSNNTVYGTQWHYVPETNGVPLVCDMSSNIMSRPVDVSKYALIYAGAQKNMSPAGLTVVIIDKSVAGKERASTPLMLGYKLILDKNSVFNTPPCYNIYILGLMLNWLKEQGGVEGIYEVNQKKAELLYGTLDASKLFNAPAKVDARSDMNVVFRTATDEMDEKFVAAAFEEGFVNVKGHKLAGGMRASIYNAMPLEVVEKLCLFIEKFDKNNN